MGSDEKERRMLKHLDVANHRHRVTIRIHSAAPPHKSPCRLHTIQVSYPLIDKILAPSRLWGRRGYVAKSREGLLRSMPSISVPLRSRNYGVHTESKPFARSGADHSFLHFPAILRLNKQHVTNTPPPLHHRPTN